MDWACAAWLAEEVAAEDAEEGAGGVCCALTARPEATTNTNAQERSDLRKLGSARAKGMSFSPNPNAGGTKYWRSEMLV
jgi:hypothetical protein